MLGLFAVLGVSEEQDACKKCDTSQFQTIDKCHLTGWIVDSGNQTYEACDNNGRLCTLTDLKVITTLIILCVVFSMVSLSRRNYLIAREMPV